MYSSMNGITNPTIDLQTQNPFDKNFSQNQVRDDKIANLDWSSYKIEYMLPKVDEFEASPIKRRQ